MPVAHLSGPPGAALLRQLALAATVRPHPGVPTCLGTCPVLANAAGWARGWHAAAVYAQPARCPPGTPRRLQAVLVLAEGLGTRAQPARWYSATLAEWHAPQG
jgi:hypothetical protein